MEQTDWLLSLVVLKSIGDCVGYTFQLRCWWLGAVVWDALLPAMPGDKHYMAVGYIRILKHGYCWSPDGMIGVHLREIRSFGYDLHNVSQLVHAKWAVFIPHDVFCGESGFGFWKNAGQEGFNLDTYNLRLANASSSALVCQDLDTKVCNYNSQLLILFLAFYVHFQSLMYTIVRLYILAYTTPQAVNCFYSNHV